MIKVRLDSGRHYADRLAAAVAARGTPAVVGLDPVLEQLPVALRPADNHLGTAVAAIEAFGRGVLDAVAPHVPAVKINAGFFEAFYGAGLAAYYRLVQQAHQRGLLVIGDVKRGDIGSTARLYARGHLAAPAFSDVSPDCVPDAVTLSGYLGEGAVRPFIDAARENGRGVYILVRPSDPGADLIHEYTASPDGGGRACFPACGRSGDASDSPVAAADPATSGPGAGGARGASRFYQFLAQLVRTWGEAPELRGPSGLSCVGAVVAPKDEASTRALRESMPTTPFLVPGYGAQGATAESCRACFLPGGQGAVVNASRSVIYAYQQPEYQQRFGEANWQACISAAAESFARDLSRFVSLPTAR